MEPIRGKMAGRTGGNGMSVRFAVVYEADVDLKTATELADRVLVEAIEWLDEDQLTHQREWLTETASRERFTWKAIKKLAREAGIRVHGHFDGEPGLPDAAAARRAILYLLETVPELKAVLLIRDQDDQPDRRIGLEQARDGDHSGLMIVIGLAIVERECWVLAGYDPLETDESTRLEEERKILGFDPRSESHQLTACKKDTATHSSKRVLRKLSGDNRDRERRCWIESSLELLRERGNKNGLADYLHEVRHRLAPIIGHVSTS